MTCALYAMVCLPPVGVVVRLRSSDILTFPGHFYSIFKGMEVLGRVFAKQQL